MNFSPEEVQALKRIAADRLTAEREAKKALMVMRILTISKVPAEALRYAINRLTPETLEKVKQEMFERRKDD